MASITGARAYVDVPAPAPKVGNILDVVRVLNSSGHDLLGAEYETFSCYGVEEWLSNCGNYPTPTGCIGRDEAGGLAGAPVVAEKKVFHGPVMVEGDPFTLYSGVECSTLSSLNAQDGANAQSSLELKEGRGVEEHLTALFAAWTGLDTVTGGRVAESVAALEGWLEENYAGQGFIGMSRQVAVLAAAAQIVVSNLNGSLSTVLGTPILLGVGDADTVYASGQITLIRGPIIQNAVPSVTYPDGTCAPARALAERTYVPLVECGVAKADITTGP